MSLVSAGFWKRENNGLDSFSFTAGATTAGAPKLKLNTGGGATVAGAGGLKEIRSGLGADCAGAAIAV